MSLYALIFSFWTNNPITVWGQVDHDGQHGNAVRTPIRGDFKIQGSRFFNGTISVN